MAKNQILLFDENYQELVEKRSYYVAQSNEAVQKLSNNFTLNERKVLLIALSKISPEDSSDTKYTISVNEILKQLGLPLNGYYYNDFKQIMKKLADTSVWYYFENEKEKKESLLRWFDTLDFVDNDGFISMQFSISKSMSPFVFDLINRGLYNQYQLWNVLLLRSKDSINLYEFLNSIYDDEIYKRKQNRISDKVPVSDVVEITLSLKYFREKFNVNYPRYADLKRYVIKKSVDEINKLTNMYVEFSEIKKGRKVDKITFNFTKLKGANLRYRISEVESIFQRNYKKLN